MNVNHMPVGGLASIIIPCWNQLEFTRQCVRALLRHTRSPWELIIIDNGSTDGTGEYLAGLQDAAPVPVTLIANATNRGFPAAINQGLHEAHGGYLVLLNNDVVVTDGWLDQLLALTEVRADRAETCGPACGGVMRPAPNGDGSIEGDLPEQAAPSTHPADASSPAQSKSRAERGEVRLWRAASPPVADRKSKMALVGPMSNYAAPPQLVDGVPYHDMAEMHAFARSWRDEHLGRWFTASKLSGFCLLMKRAVYQTIGGLDERFGLGFFDDDDLAERARRAGFELAVAHDLFVHHFGSRTFAGNGIDAEGLLDDNARRFAAKWGLPGTNGRRVALRPFAAAPRNGDRIGREDRPQMDADGKAMMIKQHLTPSHLSPPCKGGLGGWAGIKAVRRSPAEPSQTRAGIKAVRRSPAEPSQTRAGIKAVRRSPAEPSQTRAGIKAVRRSPAEPSQTRAGIKAVRRSPAEPSQTRAGIKAVRRSPAEPSQTRAGIKAVRRSPAEPSQTRAEIKAVWRSPAEPSLIRAGISQPLRSRTTARRRSPFPTLSRLLICVHLRHLRTKIGGFPSRPALRQSASPSP